mmetsp:Transcript_5477/g.12120  ORF Transcript_5477/g.12120 Transcript_5477/m.12120 type:complete len:525 (+) Transcript_5477:133-1707(+)|eukprot:CAMPEP_0202906478 /NCGR_PEP_ID=MMETSP1392-20130828/39086_1 /ASSEMBLY_ACC=CAM_ASM_000868 /TAXON_ID=225041 /ORGANISM="Chlamydomonas chlamydogama, Strain SAG 11-48b" /LENGTH=524 /DNA_ID=CAMNT_0049595011 /DNA_START=52 /DNA_END=1626 /DNA_ORIENTATION=+
MILSGANGPSFMTSAIFGSNSKHAKLAAWVILFVTCSTITTSIQGSTGDAQGVPHVSKCNFCSKCTVGDSIGARKHHARTLMQQQIAAHDTQDHEEPAMRTLAEAKGSKGTVKEATHPPWLHASAYLATHNDVVPKQSLPNCTRCYGCNTELSSMADQSQFFDRTFTNEKGATSSWLFRATTNRTDSGMAVAKVYCMPLPKRQGGRVPTCAPDTILKNMKLLLAIEKIREECGFEDLIPKIWVDQISAVVPDLGYHIRWHGLWMEYADGVSLENFLHKGEPSRFPPPVILDLMHNKLNKTQVVRAAIFDLLTSQCDRHAQNIFINEQGQIRLIDNEAALQNSWKSCGFDSILVPTTQKQEIVRLSNEFVLKLITPDQARKGHADPQLLLDYRCYLPDGKEEIGTDYPPTIKQCLQKIAGMSAKQVQKHYGFTEELPAHNLKTRATDMITKGFEWAFKYGEPRNANPKRYRMQPKCCKIKYQHNEYGCAHAWDPKFELPIGNPTTGRHWDKARQDTGSYEGGTVF